ncbi:MAG TPA: carbonic anhydrase [Acidimicrobiales bacterium]|nr:carbonic anhydrase [Acidimicrobiales bacterium]
MSVIDDLVAHNRAYVERHGHRELPTSPQLHLAVLTCMDSRLDLFGALGLNLGEAHLIRNAGGLASDDAIRSLLLSQRLLDTRSVMVIHHTRCGLETFDEETLAKDVEASVGVRPPFRLGAYRDVEEDVRSTVETLRASPFIDTTEIRGFVFDVDDADLREVSQRTS